MSQQDTPSDSGTAAAAESKPAPSSTGGVDESHEKHVRFASLDLVHNLARRLSASITPTNTDNEGGGENNGEEEQDSFFVDRNLGAEMNNESSSAAAAPTDDTLSPTIAGNKDSVILWRKFISPSKSPSSEHLYSSNNPASRLPMRYRKEAATLLVLTAVATEFIGISISLPVLVPYASSFGVPEKLTGLVFSVVGFSTFLSNLWIPIRSDRHGRKKIIVATLIGSFVAYILEASAPRFEFLLLGLFLGGFFGGTQPVAVAYISDIYSPAERPRFIGMVPACASVCFTMGPALGGALSSATDSYRIPLIFAAAVVACFLPIVMYFLPESKDILSKAEQEEIRNLEAELPERKEGRLTYDRRSTYGSICPAAGLSEVSPLVSEPESTYPGPHRDVRCYMCLFVELFRTLAFSGFVTTIPLVLQEPDFGLASAQAAVFWTGIVIGVSSAMKSIGLFVLFDRIQKRIGLVETMCLGSAVGLGAFILLIFSSSIALLTVGFSLFAFGSALIQPGNFAYVTLLVPQEFNARAAGMPNVATSIGQTVAPIAGSALLFATSYHTLYLCITIMLLLQLLITFAFLKKREKLEKEDASLTDIEEEEDEDGTMEGVVPIDEYQDLLVSTLAKVLNERNYDLRQPKAQKVVLEIISKSFPHLRDEKSANQRDLDKLFAELAIMRGKKQRTRNMRESSLMRSSIGASPSTSW